MRHCTSIGVLRIVAFLENNYFDGGVFDMGTTVAYDLSTTLHSLPRPRRIRHRRLLVVHKGTGARRKFSENIQVQKLKKLGYITDAEISIYE